MGTRLVTERAELKPEVKAAGKAREMAAALSESLNVKLIRLVSANENGHVIHPVPQAHAMMAMENRGGELPVFAGKVRVAAAVTLTYEIARE